MDDNTLVTYCVAAGTILAISLIAGITSYKMGTEKSYVSAGMIQCPYPKREGFETNEFYWTKPDSCPVNN